MEKKKKRVWSGLAAFLAVMLILLTGCQAVGNFDVNQALQKNLAVTSAEGSSSFTLDIDIDETALESEEDRAAFQLFKSIKLDLTEIKAQDLNVASLKGNLHFAGEVIPFTLVVNKTQLAIQVDGAKQPILFDMSKFAGDEEAQDVEEFMTDEFYAKSQLIGEKLGGYFYNKLPNPKTISMENVGETVHGEALNLHKLHAEIYGDEILGLVKQYLDNILNDEEGMKELIGQLYDEIAPIMSEAIKNNADEDEFTAGLIQEYLGNKTLAVEFVYSTVHQALTEAQEQWNKKTTAGIQKEIAEFFDVFNRDNVVKADLYFDKDNYLRKFAYELNLKPKILFAPELKGIKFTAAGEKWNINGEVTADRIDVKNASLVTDETTPSHVLTWFDQNSKAYDILKNDLHITHKLFTLWLTSEKEAIWYETAYIKNNETMVPARYVAEWMDGEVSFDSATKQVVIKDVLTGKTIRITIGNNTATVNGSLVKFKNPAVEQNGTLYVPLNLLTETFGATKSWDPETKEITISRD